MKLSKKLGVKRILAAMSDGSGFCTSCGFEQGQVEPDAEKYTCEQCGKPTVYGAEEIVMREL